MNKINNDLAVTYPLGGSSSSWFLVELEFENVVLWGEGKPEYPEKNFSEQEREPYVVVIPLLTCYCQSFILHLIICLFALVVSSSAWV